MQLGYSKFWLVGGDADRTSGKIKIFHLRAIID